MENHDLSRSEDDLALCANPETPTPVRVLRLNLVDNTPAAARVIQLPTPSTSRKSSSSWHTRSPTRTRDRSERLIAQIQSRTDLGALGKCTSFALNNMMIDSSRPFDICAHRSPRPSSRGEHSRRRRPARNYH